MNLVSPPVMSTLGYNSIPSTFTRILPHGTLQRSKVTGEASNKPELKSFIHSLIHSFFLLTSTVEPWLHDGAALHVQGSKVGPGDRAAARDSEPGARHAGGKKHCMQPGGETGHVKACATSTKGTPQSVVSGALFPSLQTQPPVSQVQACSQSTQTGEAPSPVLPSSQHEKVRKEAFSSSHLTGSLSKEETEAERPTFCLFCFFR